MADKLNAAEALYGFSAWISEVRLTTENIDQAIDQFIRANDLDDPREGWETKLTVPTIVTREVAGRNSSGT